MFPTYPSVGICKTSFEVIFVSFLCAANQVDEKFPLTAISIESRWGKCLISHLIVMQVAAPCGSQL